MFLVDLLCFSLNFTMKSTLALAYSRASWGILILKRGRAGAREQRKLFLVLMQAEFFFFIIYFFVIKASLRLCHRLLGTSQNSPGHVKGHSCNVRRKSFFFQHSSHVAWLVSEKHDLSEPPNSAFALEALTSEVSGINQKWTETP